MLRVSETITIRETDLDERFVHASGPGGQNVNKVATAVQLRFNANVLPDAIRARLKIVAGKRMNQAGEVVIEARRYRQRERNRDDARQRLLSLVSKAAEPPPPPRKKTRPSRASVAKKKKAHQHQKRIKSLRKPPAIENG